MSGRVFPYTVAIRSVRDNDFLRQTLASLRGQTVPPQEIVIAIPEDAAPWPVEGEGVRFVWAPRGMVTQRAAGIREARHRLILLLDDDIVLAPEAAERLLIPILGGTADCVVPYWTQGWPKAGWQRRVFGFWRIAIPQQEGGIRYAAGGGYYYPLSVPPPQGWETCGGAGAVIAINREFALSKNATGDLDLQRIGTYALREDGALILAWHQQGGRCLMIGDISFRHLGGTTRLATKRLHMAYKAQVFNHLLFWKKYVRPLHMHSVRSRIKSHIAFGWYMTGIMFFGFLSMCRERSLQPVQGILDGVRLLLKI